MTNFITNIESNLNILFDNQFFSSVLQALILLFLGKLSPNLPEDLQKKLSTKTALFIILFLALYILHKNILRAFFGALFAIIISNLLGIKFSDDEEEEMITINKKNNKKDKKDKKNKKDKKDKKTKSNKHKNIVNIRNRPIIDNTTFVREHPSIKYDKILDIDNNNVINKEYHNSMFSSHSNSNKNDLMYYEDFNVMPNYDLSSQYANF